MIQRIVMATALLICAGCALGVQTVTFSGSRTDRFLYGVAYYQELTNVKTKLVFADGEYPGRKNYCAWVVVDPMEYGQTIIGLNTKNPRCIHYKPEWLALHEICHLRMAHTRPPFDTTMPSKVKEKEAAECMRAYARERE